MEKEYLPFGEEWKKEIMKISKKDIIDMLLRPALIANQEIACRCTSEQKHGTTTIACCNHCGKSTEAFWSRNY